MQSSTLIFTNGYSRFVMVHRHVVKIIEESVEKGPRSREAGGILLGSYRGDHFEVSDYTTPQRGDVRSFAFFDRQDGYHQSFALRAWRLSSRMDTYIGEWHTHPEDCPEPSDLDRENWTRLLAKSPGPLVFAIGGWHRTWWGLGDRRHILRLDLIE